MNKLIIIKYGELTTKKGNIKFFLKTLKKNIEASLSGIDFKIEYDNGRMFIFASDLEVVQKRLENVFGIHEIIIGYEYDSIDIEDLKENLRKLVEDVSITTFKVRTKRSYKEYPLTSMEISRILGGVVLKNVEGSKVDVHNPEQYIYFEIRIKKSYIYFWGKSGLNGYYYRLWIL